MSRVRGVFPLFVVTGFGIINGIWVFGPAFKEQQLEKEAKARKEFETSNSTQDEITKLRFAEANAIQSSKESTSEPGGSSSWWGLWAKDNSASNLGAQQPRTTASSSTQDNTKSSRAEDISKGK